MLDGARRCSGVLARTEHFRTETVFQRGRFKVLELLKLRWLSSWLNMIELMNFWSASLNQISSGSFGNLQLQLEPQD